MGPPLAMKIVIISRSDLPLVLINPEHTGSDACVFVCDDVRLARRARTRGFRTVTGPLDDPRTYRRRGSRPPTGSWFTWTHDRNRTDVSAPCSRCGNKWR